MIDFVVETALTYDTAYHRYPGTTYITRLLKEARKSIKEYGKTIALPDQFADYMSDAELDYMLLLLHKNVDALIDGHIYVRLPLQHASILSKFDNSTERYVANGIGFNTIVLISRESDQSLKICLPTFEEAREEFYMHSEDLSNMKETF